MARKKTEENGEVSGKKVPMVRVPFDLLRKVDQELANFEGSDELSETRQEVCKALTGFMKGQLRNASAADLVTYVPAVAE
jgi:hypothetical protein